MHHPRLLALTAFAALGLAVSAVPASASTTPTFKVVGGQLEQKVVWESKSANTEYSSCYDLHGEDSGTTHYSLQPISGSHVRFGGRKQYWGLDGVAWAGTVAEHASRKEWQTLHPGHGSGCQNPPPPVSYAHDKGCGNEDIKPGHSGLLVVPMKSEEEPWKTGQYGLWGPFSQDPLMLHCYSYDTYTTLPIPNISETDEQQLKNLKQGERHTIKAKVTDDTRDALSYEFPYEHHGFSTAELTWSLTLERIH